MYHQFNIQQFYVLPTQCFYVYKQVAISPGHILTTLYIGIRPNRDKMRYNLLPPPTEHNTLCVVLSEQQK